MYTHMRYICLQFVRGDFSIVGAYLLGRDIRYFDGAAGPFAANPCNRFSWAWARCRRINRSQASGSRATSACRMTSWSACPSGMRPGLSAPGIDRGARETRCLRIGGRSSGDSVWRGQSDSESQSYANSLYISENLSAVASFCRSSVHRSFSIASSVMFFAASRHAATSSASRTSRSSASSSLSV